MINLSAIGLTTTDTKCYEALLTKKDWSPAELAAYVHETRTNCYKILDKLTTLGLAEKFDKGKKFHYRAANPTRLLELSRQARLNRIKAEDELEAQARSLITNYIQTNELPGIRYFQGKDELHRVYQDQVESGQPIYIIRPNYNLDLYDFDYMTEIRHMARRAGIQRYAITPDRPEAPSNYKVSDPFMLLTRTWIPQEDYTAPVEWNVYGDKLAIMSFGTEATGMIIESPQIAQAFRELYKLIDRGLRLLPDYDELPRLARYKGAVQESSGDGTKS